MNFEDFKLKIIKTATETKYQGPPVIHEEFIAKYRLCLLDSIVGAFKSNIEAGMHSISISPYSVSPYNMEFPTQHRDFVYKELLPHIFVWLKAFNIPYVTQGELTPTIIIQMEEIKRISNVDALAALK